MLSGIRRELRPMIGLAVPVILAEIGWTLMGLVDTLMVGPLGPAAIGAVGLGSIVFLAIGIFGMGLMLGLDTLVAQSYGAGRLDRCQYWLRQGVYLALISAVPFSLLAFGVTATLPLWGLNEEVREIASPYLNVVTLSVLPLLLYAALRRYLQAVNLVRPITFALLSANLVNVAVNWVLIYGKLGFPALGATGAAWATVVSRVYMAAVLYVAVREASRGRARSEPGPRRVEWEALRHLLRLGGPAGLQILLEVGVFAAATALAGRLAPAALAAHQIAMNLWAFVFMVPLGLNAAGAVRVGQAVGRRDREGVWQSGWTALALGALFTASAAVVFLVAARPLIGAFSQDTTVLKIGPSLLAIAGVCLVFDGTQGISTGILRGLGETRIPMLANLAGHWFIGLPLGYAACFWWGWGVQGLWLGLAAGLTAVGCALLATWSRRARKPLPDLPPAGPSH
ncbi:MAG TPA: MATE family efflux transporter [Vicinamibacterales bacterium]|nr:MATE family efflux transporter [Vicinamibacterales bacterium]